MNHLKTSILLFALTAFVACSSGTTMAQEGFLSDANAARAGLTVAWSTQVEISSKAPLVDWQLVVDENRATTYYVIKYGKRKEVIAEKDLSPFGVPYGIEGAKQAAEDRKEVIEYKLKNDGKEDVKVEITSYSLPESRLFVLGYGGQTICLDADTGATIWTQQVGESRLPSTGLGASKDHVAVANGSSVYCLEAATGRILWRGQCTDGINSSPACSDEYVHVPLVSGRLQTFKIDKFGLASFNRVAEGGPQSRPIITEKNVVWTTEKGHMNVAPLVAQTVKYRLKSSGPIVSQAATSNGFLYVGSMDGFVYGLKEESGQLEWEVSTGRGILKSPVAFGNDVYVISGSNELFKVDSKEGNYPKGWQVPIRDIREIAGFGVDTIYCINTRGRLIGIDRETRSVTKSVEDTSIELVMPNVITDRMFFATKSGFIQCVHEIGSLRPRFLETDLAVAKPKAPKKKRKDDSAMGEENPFGEEAMQDDENPFGDNTDKSDDDEDDDNPFG